MCGWGGMHIDQWTYRKSHDHVKLWFPNELSSGLSLLFPSSRQAELRGLVRAGPWEDATDLYKQIVKQLGCDAWGASALDCLLAKEKDTLLNVSDSYYGNCSLPHKESIVTTQWAPAMDGVILPQMPVSSTPCSGREVVSNQRAVVPQVELLEAGKVAPVAVLLGSNKDEGSTFITHPPKTVPDFYE